MSSRFRVVLTGEVLAGHDPEHVRSAAAQAFRLDAGQLDRLWGKRAVVKRDASEEEAMRFVARVRRLGLGAECEALAPPAETPAQIEPLAGKPGDDELFSLAAPAAPVQAAAPSAESITCPQCGEVQPKRTLCRKCGLDMPRYVAARAEADQVAREEKAFEREVVVAARSAGKPSVTETSVASASLLSFGFSGRLGRLGYLAGSIFGCVLFVLLLMLALKTGGKAFVGIGLLLSGIYGLRMMVVRLHDIGRGGWFLLLLLVPIVNLVLAIALYFVPGDEGTNDYGLQPFSSRGGAVLASIVAWLVVGAVFGKMLETPEDIRKLATMLRVERHGQAVQPKEEEDASYVPAAHYSAGNLVVMYSIESCAECDSMRHWLDKQDFGYVEHSVDADQAAAQQLGEKLKAIGYRGRVQLPVVEVNGVLLVNSPSPRKLHRHLRLASDA